jgi:hypothetical protein
MTFQNNLLGIKNYFQLISPISAQFKASSFAGARNEE